MKFKLSLVSSFFLFSFIAHQAYGNILFSDNFDSATDGDILENRAGWQRIDNAKGYEPQIFGGRAFIGVDGNEPTNTLAPLSSASATAYASMDITLTGITNGTPYGTSGLNQIMFRFADGAFSVTNDSVGFTVDDAGSVIDNVFVTRGDLDTTDTFDTNIGIGETFNLTFGADGLGNVHLWVNPDATDTLASADAFNSDGETTNKTAFVMASWAIGPGYEVDNVVVGSTIFSVGLAPEPGVVGLIGMGALLAMWARRRFR